MRIRLLTSLALVLAGFSSLSHASSDDFCVTGWSIIKHRLDVCSSLPFLSPGNDSQVNLRLLLADSGRLPLTPDPLSDAEKAEGYGPVPFALERMVLSPTENYEPDTSSVDALEAVLAQIGLTRDPAEPASNAFLTGEGSRCRSNADDSATAFITQLIKSTALPVAERLALASSRLQMLSACAWDSAQQDSLLPSDIQSPQGKDFLRYLHAATDFYSGRFAEAGQQFSALADSSQPWLKELALYMSGRTALNAAQATAFDDMGMTTLGNVDKPSLLQAEHAFEQYLTTYPKGDYAASATGLLRRVHWLDGDADKLAGDYVWQLTESREVQRNVSLDELVTEIDSKLLTTHAELPQTPLLQAITDLMGMRDQPKPALTLESLQAQKPVFAKQPALYDYLLAVFHFYVEKKPDQALAILPGSLPESLDYLAFSQQTLRALAMEANQDWNGAEALWLQLLPRANQPFQREHIELALAMNYERSQRVAKVFATDSPIKTPQVRALLIGHVADPDLLRQITQGTDASEHDLALFVLLYKDLLRSRYQDFASDLQQLPAAPSEQMMGANLGYLYGLGQSLKLFRWQGDKAVSGYTCPTIAETASALQNDPKSPQALNCLGEFILRNNLDGMPLDSPRAADELAGTPSGFKGEVFSRLDGYQRVIGNDKAAHNDRAYALFRAINCYAPSGFDSCGGKDVAPAVRKAWFHELKTGYADTRWGKSLQYYW